MKFSNLSQLFKMILMLVPLSLGNRLIQLQVIPAAHASTLKVIENDSSLTNSLKPSLFNLPILSALFLDFSITQKPDLSVPSQGFLDKEHLVQDSDGLFDPNIIPDAPRRSSGDDLVTTLKDSTEYSTFASLLDLADLTETLKQSNLFVLAPTEKAWANLGANAGKIIQPENREKLINYLKNYIVDTTPDSLIPQGSVKTRAGSTLEIKIDQENRQVIVNDIKIPSSELIYTKNDGMIVPVDKLLFPIE